MWSKPDWNSYKINCDAVVSESHAVISIVARNWRGFLVFAYAMRVNTNSLVQAEAEAYRWTVLQAISHNLHKVIIEGDNKSYVQVLKDQASTCPQKVSSLLKDTMTLARKILVPSFSWVPREGNKAAHVLARWALNQGRSQRFNLGWTHLISNKTKNKLIK